MTCPSIHGPVIRRMDPSELVPVVRLWRRSRDEAQPWLEARMGHSHADDLRFFGENLLRRCEVWLAEQEGRVLGLLALQDDSVEQLYVDPAEQGRGVGSALMAFAKARRPGGLTLYTHQRNQRARAFYEQRGFVVESLGVSPAPESEPDVRYRWSPDPGATARNMDEDAGTQEAPVPDAASRKHREAVVRRHMEAENVHDFDSVIATFAHPRYELVGTGQTHDGEAEVREYFRQTRTAFPDQRNELIALHHADDAVIAEFFLLGTHEGALGGLAPTGRTFKTRMCAFFVFEGDALVCERVYFDSASILRQLTGAAD